MQEDEDFVRKGPVLLPKACERVVDADEEIFILYSEIQTGTPPESADKFRGLGYVDSHKDVLEIKFELKNVVSSTSDTQLTGKRKNKSRKVAKDLDKTVEIELWQDKTALRSRKGDTGSVLWKASIDFAQLVLQKYYSGSNNGLFDRELLSTINLVELGSGTGLLSLALSPLVKHYTATDIGPLVPLIQKNVTLNFPGWPRLSSGNKGANISVEELDWMAIEAATPSQRVKIYDTEAQPIDLLLIVDCIYHPSLIPPFLTTVDYLTTPDRTAVLVVSELRAEDVMREFLEQWLSIPGWGVWRIPNDLLGKHYVIYLGWKV
ncbi:hypothetical protein GALMADRAFT_105366 [Galerina marginata CBS 339.88]|uniref:Uncharacterized protein n=1 Tax=Galerina marginata (strain CBS 339.88) TaxID=685588 RepID=A0A067SDE7_GALM3|nr:hypothetical protein GALMADRAFT_105366 [Galerina marginata CBS 339.88]